MWGKSMAILQGNTYQVPVQVTDCRGEVIVPSVVERGQFVFGSLEKFYGDGGEVWWNDELKAFMIPLTEEETFAFKGAVKYQARLLLKDGSISGTIPQSEYIRESITALRLSDGGAGVQSGSILKASLLKEVASVISNVVVDDELDINSDNAIANKVVTGAINEVNDKVNTVELIAKGATQAVAYKTYEEAVSAINELGADAFNVGQNVMIFTLSVPDLWISGVEETSESYNYVSDDEIVNALKTDGLVRVGYYTLSALETGKVDLENYYTKNETDLLLENIPTGIEQLVGTEEKPINFATGMQVGKAYSISGYIYTGASATLGAMKLSRPVLCYKSQIHTVIAYELNADKNARPVLHEFGVKTNFTINDDGTITSTERRVTPSLLNNGYVPQSIYAPTTGGVAGQVLLSNGTYRTPVWADLPAGGIEQLVGTEEKPINLATDMEVGHLYSVIGYVFRAPSLTPHNITSPLLVFKNLSSNVLFYNGYLTKSYNGVDSVGGTRGRLVIDATTGEFTSNSSLTRSYSLLGTINGTGGGGDNIWAPTTSGSQGQILQSNGSGAPTWVTPNFATLDDVNNAIGNVSSLLGDTDDLEV